MSTEGFKDTNNEDEKPAKDSVVLTSENMGGGSRTDEHQVRNEYNRHTNNEEKETLEKELAVLEENNKNIGEEAERSVGTSESEEEVMQEVEASNEQAETERELENLTEDEREKIGWGLHNVGYKIEAIKDKVFESTYSKISERLNPNSTMGRFFSSLGDQFTEKGEGARNAILNIEDKRAQGDSTKVMEKLGNVGYLTGNLLKYGRIVTDAAGWTATSVYRSAMLGSIAAASGFDAAKEARLKNEEVIDKTRVQDMDKAADEAWAIHQSAMQKKEMGEEVAQATEHN